MEALILSLTSNWVGCDFIELSQVVAGNPHRLAAAQLTMAPDLPIDSSGLCLCRARVTGG